MKSKISNWKLRLVLATILTLSVTACAGVISETPTTQAIDYCPIPPWPYAGAKVAAEIDKLDEKEFPYTTDWLSRLKTFKLQLDKTRKEKK